MRDKWKNTKGFNYEDVKMEVYRLGAFKVELYFYDHPPAHFHIVHKDGRNVSVALDDFEFTGSDIKRHEVVAILKWCRENREFLEKKFEELSSK